MPICSIAISTLLKKKDTRKLTDCEKQASNQPQWTVKESGLSSSAKDHLETDSLPRKLTILLGRLKLLLIC